MYCSMEQKIVQKTTVFCYCHWNWHSSSFHHLAKHSATMATSIPSLLVFLLAVWQVDALPILVSTGKVCGARLYENKQQQKRKTICLLFTNSCSLVNFVHRAKESIPGLLKNKKNRGQSRVNTVSLKCKELTIWTLGILMGTHFFSVAGSQRLVGMLTVVETMMVRQACWYSVTVSHTCLKVV
jgi:hypothetical protein